MADDLNEKLDKDFLDTWWGRVRFWFLARKVYRAKTAALWEANLDKLYFESQYPDILSYDDTKDRTAMSLERKKPLTDQDQKFLIELDERITHNKAVKDSYYQTMRLCEELKDYIKMLELWMSRK